MGDKDVDGVLGALAAAPSLAGARVVATAVEGPRALPAADLAARWSAVAGTRSGPVAAVADPAAAVAAAVAAADGPGRRRRVAVPRRGRAGLLVDDPELRDPA